VCSKLAALRMNLCQEVVLSFKTVGEWWPLVFQKRWWTLVQTFANPP